MAEKDEDGLEIVIRGRVDRGKTTVANLVRTLLQEVGFRKIRFADVRSSRPEAKDDLAIRLERARDRPVSVRVELIDEGRLGPSSDPHAPKAVDCPACGAKAGSFCAPAMSMVLPYCAARYRARDVRR